MRKMIALVMLSGIVGLGSAVDGATPQARPGQATTVQPAPAKDRAAGVLRGVVIAADTGGVLRRARITANAPGLRETRATTTDSQGRWELKNLPAGRFTVTASKPQYVTLQYGQRYPTEDGRPVEVAAGQTIDRIDFRLPRGSVISGRIVDDLGEPAESVFVQAYRLEYVNGQRKLGPAGVFGTTDDLGQYRLAGLPPGTYYVGSMATTWGAGSPEDTGVSFGETFAPGTLRQAEAQPVLVRTGQERPGVDFGLQAVRMATVSGIVVDSEGAPVANANIMMMQERQGASGMTVMSTSSTAWTTRADGRFTIPNVAPGDYSFASYGAAGGFTAASERGSAFVTVSGQDVSELMIALHKGSRITGQVEFEGDPPPLSPAIRIYAIEPGGSHGMSMPGTSTIGEDWSFEITGVSPGKRVFRMPGLPSTHVLKSVFVQGADDAIDTKTEVDGREEIKGVRLVVSNRPTTVTGDVTDDRGKPVEEYAVVAFASDPERWGPSTRYVATARPDQHGRFTVTGLPPGNYLVAALDRLERGESSSPEFLGSIKGRATEVALLEGEVKAVSLKVIAPERER